MSVRVIRTIHDDNSPRIRVCLREDPHSDRGWVDLVPGSSPHVAVEVGYSGSFWGRLPDDSIRSCNELFIWDEEG